MTEEAADGVAIFLIAMFWILVYIMPWMVASSRRTKNRRWVGLVNFFLGWTIIGWFAAFIMAVEGKKEGKHNAD